MKLNTAIKNAIPWVRRASLVLQAIELSAHHTALEQQVQSAARGKERANALRELATVEEQLAKLVGRMK